jgi:regulator of protease activity HflC (stomatin/prohibitin superfamily)
MANISRMLRWRHLRAEPNQFILQWKRGKLVRKGAGVAGWFDPLTAALAQVPVEDCETTFLLKERTSDFQEVSVQCTLTYRVTDPELAAQRVNFSLSLHTGAWLEQPMERLASIWQQRTQPPARSYLAKVSVEEAVRGGADVIREAILGGLRADSEVAAMGLVVVNLQIVRIAPSADVEKALQAPTRELIQQRADEATFSRRANAVEKERAIKENELRTEIALSAQQQNLIEQQGKNELQTIQQQSDAKQAQLEALMARRELAAKAHAVTAKLRAGGDVEAQKLHDAQKLAAEAQRLDAYRAATPQVMLGIALQEFAEKLPTIQNLNLSPDLLRDTLQQFLASPPGRKA